EREELEAGSALLKLSVREQKALRKTWDLLQDPQAFLALSEGKKIKAFAQEGVEWGLQLLQEDVFKTGTSAIKTAAQKLRQRWEQMGRTLPGPLLNGEDVKDSLQGKARGLCLEQAYERQLEGKLHSREEALQWLREYIKKEAHG
ncbi:MAG: CCA tRNA nucleotidyltransferase, partial [Bdellovibrio sp.]